MKKLRRIACPLTLGFHNSTPSSASWDFAIAWPTCQDHCYSTQQISCHPGCRTPSIALFSQHFHSTKGHCGLEFTRALVQQQFWILKARQLIRRCIISRRQLQDVIQPIMADLRKKDYLPRSTFHSVKQELNVWDHFSSKPRVPKTIYTSLHLSRHQSYPY